MNVDGLNKVKSKPNNLIYTPLELSKKLIPWSYAACKSSDEIFSSIWFPIVIQAPNAISLTFKPDFPNLL